MTRTRNLEGKVRVLYELADQALKADWTQWLFQNHVFVVSANARRVAPLFHADPDLAAAGGMLHDIADVQMERHNPSHAAATIQISKRLLLESGFSDAETELLTSDAIPKHSCHDNNLPETPEGKAVAAGDALAHLMTDFYIHGTWAMGKNRKTLEWTKKWALEKIERDYHVRTFLPEVKEMALEGYNSLKFLFD